MKYFDRQRNTPKHLFTFSLRGVEKAMNAGKGEGVTLVLPADGSGPGKAGLRVTDYKLTGLDPTRHVKNWRTAWRTLTKEAALPGRLIAFSLTAGSVSGV